MCFFRFQALAAGTIRTGDALLAVGKICVQDLRDNPNWSKELFQTHLQPRWAMFCQTGQLILPLSVWPRVCFEIDHREMILLDGYRPLRVWFLSRKTTTFRELRSTEDASVDSPTVAPLHVATCRSKSVCFLAAESKLTPAC